MGKPEKIVLVSAIVIFTGLVAYGVWRSDRIDKNPVYILAKVYAVHDTENGLIYSFKYVYNSVEYDGGVKGFIRMKDSIIVLKISKDNPKLYEYVELLPTLQTIFMGC